MYLHICIFIYIMKSTIRSQNFKQHLHGISTAIHTTTISPQISFLNMQSSSSFLSTYTTSLGLIL